MRHVNPVLMDSLISTYPDKSMEELKKMELELDTAISSRGYHIFPAHRVLRTEISERELKEKELRLKRMRQIVDELVNKLCES